MTDSRTVDRVWVATRPGDANSLGRSVETNSLEALILALRPTHLELSEVLTQSERRGPLGVATVGSWSVFVKSFRESFGPETPTPAHCHWFEGGVPTRIWCEADGPLGSPALGSPSPQAQRPEPRADSTVVGVLGREVDRLEEKVEGLEEALRWANARAALMHRRAQRYEGVLAVVARKLVKWRPSSAAASVGFSVCLSLIDRRLKRAASEGSGDFDRVLGALNREDVG